MFFDEIANLENLANSRIVELTERQVSMEETLRGIEKDVKNASQKELGDATMLPIIYFWNEMVSFEDAFQRINE